jgi:hypothetical protein
MSASSFIRRHIFGLPEGGTLTTRDCLAFGSRAAVDQALSRLVKSGRMRRLARGVFAKDSSERKKYSIFEIAKLKAESFGRKIAKHPSTIACELKITEMPEMPPDREIEVTFSIDARTTKFRAGDTTIHLKQASSRKMRLAESTAGQAMRALWQFGRHSLTGSAIQQAVLEFNSLDRLELRQNIRWLPSWLTASLRLTPRWQPVRPI